MITTIFNKVYVDTNIPKFFPGTSGEHVMEFYMGCSRGARLNKKVVVIKPKNPTNRKLYDLMPVGVDLQVVELKTIKGLMLRVLIYTFSMEFFRYGMKHLYSWIRVRVNIASRKIDSINKKIIYKPAKYLISLLQVWIEGKFYRRYVFLDKKEIDDGVSFEISPSDIEYSKQYLKQKNINIKNKFVCIHVRDHIGKLGNHRESYGRGCSIDNYFPTIKYLMSEGYSVVKLGLGASKISEPSVNIIDFSCEKFPDIIPMYLISQCEFVISYQSGFIPYVSYMFQKPVLMLNVAVAAHAYPVKCNSMMILKTLIKKDNKKEANFVELIDDRIVKLKKLGKMDNFYEFIDNTEEEILLSTQDMLQFIRRNFKANDDQIFLRNFLTEKNIEVLEKKEDVGVYNNYMKATGGHFIGSGVFCDWYAKKKRKEVEKVGGIVNALNYD